MLINCLSLRRPKDTVELPPYHNQERYLDFREDERLGHEQMKKRTEAKLASVDASVNTVTLVNTLKWINELRLMCNHGQRSFEEIETPSTSWGPAEARNRFDMLESSGLAKCSNPACDQDLSSVLANEEDQVHDDDPYISESLIIWCHTCRHSESDSKNTQVRVCNHIPRHIKQFKHTTESSTTYGGSHEGKMLPTKLQALIRDLIETPPGIKR